MPTPEAAADLTAITPELDALLEEMYSTITGTDPVFEAASISMNIPKIINARRKYIESPSAENKQAYIASLEELYMDHWTGVKSTSGQNPYTAPIYKADGILDTREAAQLTAKFQQRNTRGSGTSAPTIASVYNDAIARLDRMLPKVPTSQLAGGNWSQEPISSTAETIFNTLYESIKKQRNGSPRPAEDKVRARLLTNKVLKNMVFNSSAMFVSLKNKDTGDTIRAYVNPRTGTSSPKIKASPAQLKEASESMAKIRENSNVQFPMMFSLIAASSMVPGTERFSKSSSATIGYAFPGGGVHIYLDRVEKYGETKAKIAQEEGTYDGWWSTNVTTGTEVMDHISAHEFGHDVMYKIWGNDTSSDNGSRELAQDYKKVGLTNGKTTTVGRIRLGSPRQYISRYGLKSVEEHFAESYAKYIVTGEATPEFRALLESKNLLKSQKNN